MSINFFKLLFIRVAGQHRRTTKSNNQQKYDLIIPKQTRTAHKDAEI